MCKDCFSTEYKKFKSQIEYDDFIKKFDLKIAKTLHYIETKKDGLYSPTIYKCSSCKQTWWLSDPDNPWDGYFLKEQNVKQFIDSDRKKGWTFGCGCIIMAAVLFYFLVKAWFR